MDSEVMDVRLQSWIPVLKAQAESGLNKREFCEKEITNKAILMITLKEKSFSSSSISSN